MCFKTNAKILNNKAISLLWYIFFKCTSSYVQLMIHYVGFGYLKFYPTVSFENILLPSSPGEKSKQLRNDSLRIGKIHYTKHFAEQSSES